MTGARSGGTTIGTRYGDVAAPQRVPASLRFLLRLTIALVTLLVCACTASDGARSPGFLGTAVDVVAAKIASAERGVQAGSSHHWHDRVPHGAEADLEAEADDDDDDLRDGSDLVALSFRPVPAPRERARTFWRREHQVDPTRFAAGTGLPRGPPV